MRFAGALVAALIDTSAPLNCTGEAACAADCLYSSPCDDIKHNGPTFSGCIKACAP